VQALFLRHEGYLGAIGAFLKGAEEYGEFCSKTLMKYTFCIPDIYCYCSWSGIA
jgi:hypothetical protein